MGSCSRGREPPVWFSGSGMAMCNGLAASQRTAIGDHDCLFSPLRWVWLGRDLRVRGLRGESVYVSAEPQLDGRSAGFGVHTCVWRGRLKPHGASEMPPDLDGHDSVGEVWRMACFLGISGCCLFRHRVSKLPGIPLVVHALLNLAKSPKTRPSRSGIS